MPFNMATPKTAMNPTAAGTERYSPETASAIIPPTIAKGILVRISAEARTEPSVK